MKRLYKIKMLDKEGYPFSFYVVTRGMMAAALRAEKYVLDNGGIIKEIKEKRLYKIKL